jgi:hypothetical protein
LANVLAAPGEVFDTVRNSAASPANWLTPAIIYIVVGWLGAWLILSQESFQHQVDEITEQAIQKQVEQGKLSKDNADRAIEATQKWTHISTKIGGYGSPPLMAFFTPFWGGLVIWLVGTKVLKGNFPYMKAVEVAGLGNMIGVLEAVARTLVILATGSVFASTSLALLVKDFNPQNPLHSVLAMANIMTFWFLGVRAVGLARLSQVSFAKAAAWVFGIYFGIVGFFWGLGVAAQALVKRATGS